MTNSYIISKNNISLAINGELTTISTSHVNFEKIKKSLSAKRIDWKRIELLLNVQKALLSYIGNNLKIIDNEFTYKFRGKTIVLDKNSSIVQRIIKGYTEGQDYIGFVKFLDNLTKNPLKSVINELYLFLEANDIPITNDGYFLAYKKVRADYKDIYSGTFDNSVGKTVSMPRRDVQFDREITCSTGLHFCSKSYLSHYSSSENDHIMIVKINPKDVVSIPSDYNNAKGRCCKYEVIDELKRIDTPLEKFKDLKLKTRKNHKIEQENLQDKNKLLRKIQKSIDEVIDKTLPVFATVEDMRKNFKPRVVNAKCYVYNSKKDVYTLYQFINGTSNKNLRNIRSYYGSADSAYKAIQS